MGDLLRPDPVPGGEHSGRRGETGDTVGQGNGIDTRNNAICYPGGGENWLEGSGDGNPGDMSTALAVRPRTDDGLIAEFCREVETLRREGKISYKQRKNLLSVALAIEQAAVKVTAIAPADLVPPDFCRSDVIDAIQKWKTTDHYSAAVRTYLYLHETPYWPETISPEVVIAALRQKLSPRPANQKRLSLPADLENPFVAKWAQDKLRSGVGENSVETQRSAVRVILRAAAEIAPDVPNDFTRIHPAQLTSELLEDIWTYLATQGNKSTTLAMQFHYCSEWFDSLIPEVVEENPLADYDFPKAEYECLVLPGDEEIASYLDEVQAGPEPELHLAATLIMRGCGLRPSEAAGLQTGDLSILGGWVRPFGKGGVDRTIPLPAVVREAVARYLALQAERTQGPLLVHADGSPLIYKHILHSFQEAKRESGLQWPRGPHFWRHVFATRLAEEGVDPELIRQLMGHKTLAMLTRYVHLSDIGIGAALDGLYSDALGGL